MQLSQEALAERLDVSVRHLSFIENGKSLPSEALATALCNVLLLDVAACNHLRRLGGHRIFVQPPQLTDAIATILKQTLNNAEPMPAIALDSVGNILGSNAVADSFFSMLFTPDELQNHNFFMRLLQSPSLEQSLTNWATLREQVVRHVWAEQQLLEPASAEWLFLESLLTAEAIPQHQATNEELPMF